jgi:hypothetical protein
MSTGSRRGTVVVICLLSAGCLSAGLASEQSAATVRLLSSRGLTVPANQGSPGVLSPTVLDTMYANDVGVWNIITPSGYVGFGDRIVPRGRVTNLGTQTQTDIAVTCVIYDSAAGARAYGPETVEVASLDSGEICTVDFPFWDAPTEEKVYFDTMVTVLSGDEDTANDRKAGRFAVAAWVDEHLTYNDGETGPDGAYTWISPNYSLGVRFPGPCPVNKISVGLLTFPGYSHGPFPCTCKVRLDDGTDGMPGTTIWQQPLTLYADTNDYINYIVLDPPALVTTDSFYVTWKPQWVAPPVMSADWDDPIQAGNDFGTAPTSETFYSLAIGRETDASADLIIDAYYDGPVLDGSPNEIAVPPEQLDSNTTFTPRVVVKNAGLLDRDSIVARFFITSNSDGVDTIYAGVANTGPIQAGDTQVVTFADSVTLAVGYYTMTGITLLPYDGRRGNDTLARPLSVGLGVADVNMGPGRSSVSIAPNPIRKHATVRYSLPGVGPATLDLFDVTGRTVLSQALAARRTGTAGLDLRHLRAGVYVVRVQSAGFGATRKLIVEH